MKKVFALGLALSGLFISCEDNGGYETTETGLSYKFHTQVEGSQKPNEGDVVQLNVYFKAADDSVMFDSKSNAPDGSGTIDFMIGKSSFAGSFEEAVLMMGVGDSASFQINADSFYLKTFRAPELPSNIQPGSDLTFEVKLVSIVKTKDQLAKENEERMKQQQEIMEKRKSLEPQEIEAYLSENNVKVKPTESGIYFLKQSKGSGEQVVEGKTVQVNYTGKLLDGTVFDTSEGKPEPFAFQVGTPQIIPGWNEVLKTMKVGGKATVLIPSSMAYREYGAGQVIMPYTPLIFDIEVVSLK